MAWNEEARPPKECNMRAIRVDVFGGPEVLRMVEVPQPIPGPGEALIQHGAIGVNFVDTQHRAGRPYPVSLPLIPGTEAAGVVAAPGHQIAITPRLARNCCGGPVLSSTVFWRGCSMSRWQAASLWARQRGPTSCWSAGELQESLSSSPDDMQSKVLLFFSVFRFFALRAKKRNTKRI